jgi:hypothetical protein
MMTNAANQDLMQRKMATVAQVQPVSSQTRGGYKRRNVQPVGALKEKPQAGLGLPISRWNATMTLTLHATLISMVSRSKRPSSVPSPSLVERPS